MRIFTKKNVSSLFGNEPHRLVTLAFYFDDFFFLQVMQVGSGASMVPQNHVLNDMNAAASAILGGDIEYSVQNTPPLIPRRTDNTIDSVVLLPQDAVNANVQEEMLKHQRNIQGLTHTMEELSEKIVNLLDTTTTLGAPLVPAIQKTILDTKRIDAKIVALQGSAQQRISNVESSQIKATQKVDNCDTQIIAINENHKKIDARISKLEKEVVQMNSALVRFGEHQAVNTRRYVDMCIDKLKKEFVAELDSIKKRKYMCVPIREHTNEFSTPPAQTRRESAQRRVAPRPLPSVPRSLSNEFEAVSTTTSSGRQVVGLE